MIEVRPPNQPAKGVTREKSVACRQSTCPENTGMSAPRNARTADTAPIEIARPLTAFRPHRLITVKNATSPQAITAMGMPGKIHWWIADAERIAVSPQAGTQPHQ
jgi:hypothetical protein